MRLNEIKKSVPLEIEVASDAEFESLGLVSYNRPEMLVFIEDSKYIPVALKNNNVSAVLTTKTLASSLPAGLGRGITANPRKAFFEIHNYLAATTEFYGKPFETQIAPGAQIHPTAYVASQNVRIGERCEIGPHVSVLEGSIIEDDVIIRAGSVIGTEGFEFNRIGREIMSVIHAGGVLIHSRVEIQANCCISKAVFGGFTEIGEDTKLSTLIKIAHGVVVGKRCLLAACATVSGSARIGDDVWIGPSASISSEIVIGDGASVTIGSVVTKDVAPGQRVTGNFAIDHERFLAFMKTIQ